PDLFMREMKDIPNLKERLDSWAFKKHFDTIISEISPDIDCILEASKQVTESKKFGELLGHILAIANFMNGKRNKTYGFKMNSLTKVIIINNTKTIIVGGYKIIK